MKQNTEEEQRELAARREQIRKENAHKFAPLLDYMEQHRKETLELMRRRHAYYTKLITDAEIKTAVKCYERYREQFLMDGIKLELSDNKEWCSIHLELWSYADYTYCLTSLPFRAGGKRDEALEIFNWITHYSDITVLQDDLKEPYNYFPIEMDKGLVRFLDLLLSHPHKGRSSELDDLPFGVWATEKQLWMALNAMYANNMPEYYDAGTFSFHKSTHEY